ncbi:DUF6118 family protein [Sphingomonas sp. CJ20]
MTDETTAQTAGDIDDPEVAFATMSRKLAGLTAAVEGFAARQQELHARDYGPDLAKVHERWNKVVEAFYFLADKPGVALTPETIGQQIAEAGAQVRSVDHQAWDQANRELGVAIRSLQGMVESAATAENQKRWMIGIAVGASVLGLALGAILPMAVARSVPESWRWPERAAARMLERPEWDAGVHLLRVADPARLRALDDAARLVQDNAKALAECRKRAARSSDAIMCRIEVGTPKAR